METQNDNSSKVLEQVEEVEITRQNELDQIETESVVKIVPDESIKQLKTVKLYLEDFDKLEKLYIDKKKILEFAMDVQKIKEKKFFKKEMFDSELPIKFNNQVSDRNKIYVVKIENLNELKKFMQKKRDIIAHQFEIFEYEEKLNDQDFVMKVDNQFKFQLDMYDKIFDVVRKLEHLKENQLKKLNIDLDLIE